MEKVEDRRRAPSEAAAGELVTICAECRRIIHQPEGPASATSEAPARQPLVSHGICEECARRLYGPILNRDG